MSTTQSFDLKGRAAIVTGGGKGIGRAVAEAFACAGAGVIVATRSESSGRAAVEAIREAGGEAHLFARELVTRQDARDLVAMCVDRFGRLDIVVHNAAYVPITPLLEISDTDLDKVIDVSLKMSFWLTQEAFPHLRLSPAPRLLFTSSLSGNQMAHMDLVHYSTVKSGLNGFIKGAALNLAEYGIIVSGVEPGLTLTDIFGEHANQDKIEKIGKSVPIGRAAQPSEIAQSFLFLASDAASYLTGRTLVVDGGLSLGTTQRLAGNKR